MNGTVVTRAKRKLFYGVPASGGSGDPTYTRMNGYSTLTESKNPKEHTVQYVDMEMEVTTTTGVSSSYDFTFERLAPNTVHNDMTGIIDSEKIGDDAVRTFISVDFTNKNSDGTYPAVKRDYLIVGNTIGDGTETLNYSGTLKAKTPRIEGKATISSPESGDDTNVEQITFAAGE